MLLNYAAADFSFLIEHVRFNTNVPVHLHERCCPFLGILRSFLFENGQKRSRKRQGTLDAYRNVHALQSEAFKKITFTLQKRKIYCILSLKINQTTV